MKSLRFTKAAVLAVFALVLSFGFIGCNPTEDEVDADNVVALTGNEAIVGIWQFQTEYFPESWTITPKEFKNGSPSEPDSGYCGKNVRLYEISDSEGLIFFKYTKAFCITHSDFDNYVYTYDTDAANVGKWYAVRYAELKTENGVTTAKFSGCSEGSGKATLEEAITVYAANVDTYFSLQYANVNTLVLKVQM